MSVHLFSQEGNGGKSKTTNEDIQDLKPFLATGARSIKIDRKAGNWQAFTGPNYTGNQADILVDGEKYNSLKEMDIGAPIMSICKNREGNGNEVLLFSLEFRGGEVKTTNEDIRDLSTSLKNGALSIKIGAQTGNWQAFTGPNYTGKQAEVLVEGGEYHSLKEMDIGAPIMSICKNRIGNDNEVLLFSLEHRGGKVKATDKVPPVPPVPGQAFQLMPGKTSRLDGVVCVSPPAVAWSPSPSTSLRVPEKSLSGNAVIWSPKCVSDPCPFSACQLLSHRRLPCGFPQVSVADSGRPVDAKDFTQASIQKGL